MTRLRFLTRLSLAWKLRLAFGGYLVVLAVAGTLIYAATGNLHSKIEEKMLVTEPLRAASFELEINAIGAGFGVAKYLHRADPSDRARFIDDRQDFQIFYRRFTPLARNDRERALAGELGELSTQYFELGEDIINDKIAAQTISRSVEALLGTVDRIIDKEFGASILPSRKKGAEATQDCALSPDSRSSPSEIAEFTRRWLSIASEIARIIVLSSSPAGEKLDERSKQIDALNNELHEHQAEFVKASIKLSSQNVDTHGLTSLTGDVIDYVDELVAIDQHISEDLNAFVTLGRSIDDLLVDEIQVGHKVELENSLAAAGEGIRRTDFLLIGIGAILALSETVLCVAFARAIIRPTKILARYVEAIGQNEYDAEPPALRSPEFALVGAKLRDMAHELKSTHATLLKSNEHLEQQVAARTAELAQNNIKLKAAGDKAQAANVAKTTFLTNMSHELRTPLNAIIGFSQIMRGKMFGPLGNERYESYMVDIQGAGEHLLQVVNDILDISRIELNSVELNEVSINPAELIEQTIKMITPRAREGQVMARISAPKKADHPARARGPGHVESGSLQTVSEIGQRSVTS
ncbi:MAG: hypothetical protein EXQ98_06980 [Alphaproteobacteria bacterium]|nr:hypothetical protein [Alphaproteobacteria bacterium]